VSFTVLQTPVQVHVTSYESKSNKETEGCVPPAHNSASVGVLEQKDPPSAVPHCPSSGDVTPAVQGTEEPPQSQVQLQGPEPLTADGVP